MLYPAARCCSLAWQVRVRRAAPRHELFFFFLFSQSDFGWKPVFHGTRAHETTSTTTRMRTHARTRTSTRALKHTRLRPALPLCLSFLFPFEPSHPPATALRLPASLSRRALFPQQPCTRSLGHPSFDCSNGCAAHAIIETLIDHIGVIFLRPLHRFLPPPITPPCFISTLHFPPSHLL